MNDKVQVTLDREDWERIIRLVQGVVPAATQSVDDAYEWDEDEPRPGLDRSPTAQSRGSARPQRPRDGCRAEQHRGTVTPIVGLHFPHR